MASQAPITQTKTINREDARTGLADAIGDVAHIVHEEHPELDRDALIVALSIEFANALPQGLDYYEDEQNGVDGTVVVITG